MAGVSYKQQLLHNLNYKVGQSMCHVLVKFCYYMI